MKKIALIIIAVLLVLIGAGAWLLSGTSGDSVQRDEVRIDVSAQIEP